MEPDPTRPITASQTAPKRNPLLGGGLLGLRPHRPPPRILTLIDAILMLFVARQHVIDGLLNYQTEVGPSPHRHHTDGGGVSDHVFALCALLGFQFAPRIPDLKDRRLHSFAKPSTYPTLEPLIAGRIDTRLIHAHWTDILRIATSIRTGTVTASLILRQLASYPRQNGVAAALRELGRLERTLFTLDWL